MRRALFVLVCLVLAGCSQTPSPGSLPPLSASPPVAGVTPAAPPVSTPPAVPLVSTPPAAPSPTPRIAPPADQAYTRESAEAFGRYWYDVLNDAQASMDGSGVLAIGGPECTACRDHAAMFAARASRGETYQGGRFQPTYIVCAPLDDTKTAGVSMTYDRKPIKTFDRNGNVIEQFPAAKNGLNQMELRWETNRWRVVEVFRG